MRFLLDVMCGGLVSYLRMCNHDTVYAGDRDLEADDAVLAATRAEDRTLVTRDVALANRAASDPGLILLECREVEAQLEELAAAGVPLELADEPQFCGRCNGTLEATSPASEARAGREIPNYVPTPVSAPGSAAGENDGHRRGMGTAGGDSDDSGENRRRDLELRRCRSCGQFFWRGSHWDRVEATLSRIDPGPDAAGE
ncbi:Mut7-C RNAse domain-containing protein [Halobiforma nitratireducens]|uniref:Mut7-C RNAse domain-containing protein n=1 Tax=Halobiforma nitratireducens JCM 10879 TaxID=1227454 RepID=M0MER8_9EURY|nr:Mut7-C RNAse domain-containing protein [Halobiforma nitratireducens]EMA42905.1 hypothetical protein C446_03626 [Halobiforma nitratireducens JCM 10879]